MITQAQPGVERGRFSSLQQNAAALALSSVVTSILGFFFWVVAARVHGPAVIGEASADLSLVILLASVAQLSNPTLLPWFLPRAGRYARQLVATAYGSTLAACAVCAAAMVLAIRQGLVAEGAGTMRALLLVVAIPVWALFSLQDAALVGLNRSSWVPIENAVYGGLKIVALLVFAGLSEGPVTAAWFLPAVLLIPVVSSAVHRLASRREGAPATGLTKHALLSSAAHDFAGGICGLVAIRLIPVLVVAQLGAVRGAYFFISWQLIAAAEAALSAVGTALLVELAKVDRPSTLAVGALRRWLPALTALVVVVAVLSKKLLGAYGGEYATHSTTALQILLLSLPLRLLLDTTIAVMRTRMHLRWLFALQVARAPIGLGSLLLLTDAFGVNGAAFSYTGTSLVLGVVGGAFLLRGMRQESGLGSHVGVPGVAFGS